MQVRPQHYGFIHFALRQFAFEDPGYCLTVLLSGKGPEFIDLLWEHTSQFCDPSTRDAELSSKDIHLFPALLQGNRGVIVEMPEPRHPTEAYFAALLPLGRPPRLRYFTLEMGEERGPRRVLGEWTQDNGHINHGGDMPSSMGDFLGAIAERFPAASG